MNRRHTVSMILIVGALFVVAAYFAAYAAISERENGVAQKSPSGSLSAATPDSQVNRLIVDPPELPDLKVDQPLKVPVTVTNAGGVDINVGAQRFTMQLATRAVKIETISVGTEAESPIAGQVPITIKSGRKFRFDVAFPEGLSDEQLAAFNSDRGLIYLFGSLLYELKNDQKSEPHRFRFCFVCDVKSRKFDFVDSYAKDEVAKPDEKLKP